MASTEWELTVGSSVTASWMSLSSSQGECTAQHRSDNQAVHAAQNWPAPAIQIPNPSIQWSSDQGEYTYD